MTVILGIETSCDETAAAIVDDNKQIHANVIYSQLSEHAAYGGVVPEIAARAHAVRLDDIIQQAVKEAGVGLEQIDAFAATAGPGLIGGVLVGAMTAKALAAAYNKPLLMINHLEGHALTARLTDDVFFPYLLLLVSGGHCQWLEVHGVGEYRLLGGTIDDALGEAYDKVAKMMDLPQPGGPAIERLAKEGDSKRFTLPHPLKDRPVCDMSFAGLKTSIRYQLREIVQRNGVLTDIDKADMAASFELTVCNIIQHKLSIAMQQADSAITQLVVAGGVAANQAIRKTLHMVCDTHGWICTVPPAALCTDNAAMIAWAGQERFALGKFDTLDFDPRARWSLASSG